jgi:hypothetical protein|tara:strand:- start:33644 stop:34516 length:873 start_codon:yes stop_codon:yes gene_type:complete
MSYIGKSPNLGQLYNPDVFSGNGSTTFTLTNSVTSDQSVIVSISGVKQQVSTYSISGMSLVFGTAPPSATNNIEVQYLASSIDVGTVGNSAIDSAQIASGAVDDSHITGMASSKLTGTIPDARFPATLPAVSGASLTNLPAVNTPMFYVAVAATQTLTSGTVTRITGFPASATISTGSGYASSRFTCPTGGAGNYIIGGNLSFHASGNDLSQVYTKIYKNGTWMFGGYGFSLNTSTSGAVHFADQALTFLTLAEGDTVDIYGQAVGSGTIRQFSNDGGNKNFSNFWGWKL